MLLHHRNVGISKRPQRVLQMSSSKLLLLIALTAITLAVGFSSDLRNTVIGTFDPLLNPRPVHEYATIVRAKVGQNIIVQGKVMDIIMSYDVNGASRALVVEVDDDPLSQQYNVVIVVIPNTTIQGKIAKGITVKITGTVMYASKENRILYIRASNISVVEKTNEKQGEESAS